jgi:hypothetical protein
MQRYRAIHCPRVFTINKYRFLCLFLFSAFIFLLIIYIIRTPTPNNINLSHHGISYEKPLDLLNREKILVPVHVNKLYDYQVVCPGNNGILNRNDLINQLSKTCQIDLNETVNINLNPPDDFQIRSTLPTKYVKLWQTTETCSIYQNETIAIIISYRDR